MVDVTTLQSDFSTGGFSKVAASGVPSAAYNPPTGIAGIESAASELGSIQSFNFPPVMPKYTMNFIVSDYSRSSLLSLGSLNPIGFLSLPLPIPLLDSHTVAFEETALGAFAGNIVNQATNALGAGRPDTTTLSAQSKTISAIRDKLTGVPGMESILNSLGGLGGAGLGTALEQGSRVPVVSGFVDAIKAFVGISPNQFITILLKGPRYKKYQFQWRFSPNSEQEARKLKDIVRNLNNWMAPGLALSGAIFTFPKIFQISFSPNPIYMYKFKPAVLEGLTVNYAPGGQPSFYRASGETDGQNPPEGLDIAMQFLELEYWLNGDFVD